MTAIGYDRKGRPH